MQILKFVVLLFLTCLLGSSLASSNERHQIPENNHINYDQQSRWINENLIIHFVQTFKHINLATLLVCPSSTTTVSFTENDDNGNGAAKTTTRTEQQSYTKLLINISKHLMAASILIKATDIDLASEKVSQHEDITNSASSRSSSSSSDVLERGPNQKLETNGSSICCMNKKMTTSPSVVSNMLKSGDFKQAVVLQLSCQKSKFILQQVRAGRSVSWRASGDVCVWTTGRKHKHTYTHINIFPLKQNYTKNFFLYLHIMLHRYPLWLYPPSLFIVLFCISLCRVLQTTKVAYMHDHAIYSHVYI